MPPDDLNGAADDVRDRAAVAAADADGDGAEGCPREPACAREVLAGWDWDWRTISSADVRPAPPSSSLQPPVVPSGERERFSSAVLFRRLRSLLLLLLAAAEAEAAPAKSSHVQYGVEIMRVSDGTIAFFFVEEDARGCYYNDCGCWCYKVVGPSIHAEHVCLHSLVLSELNRELATPYAICTL